MEKQVSLIVGFLGSVFAGFFGGWSDGIKVLLIFMVVDYITGIITAAVFKNSKKTETGGLESNYCFKGIVKKCFMITLVGIGYQLDKLTGFCYIRDCICFAFISNELLSIIENAGLMGIPIPKVLTDAIDILKRKEKEEN